MIFGRLLRFQSLSRDSGRLNLPLAISCLLNPAVVSIPQSGFGAFERAHGAGAHLPLPRGFNPSVGIRGV